MGINYRRDLWKLLLGVPGDIVEIGVAEGNFSADMLAWPITPRRVYMVDRWRSVETQKGDASNPQSWHEKNYADAVARVAPFGDRAVILRGNSCDMAKQVPDRSLALVYIDGDHSYAGCLADIQAWMSKVVPGGYMAFHDYENLNYGVNQAVKQFAKVTKRSIELLPEDKPEDAGAYIKC